MILLLCACAEDLDSTEQALAPKDGITSPTNGSTVIAGSIAVTGVATDDVAVVKVEVKVDNGAYAPATLAAPLAKSTTWAATVTLSSGAHSITARVTDRVGGQGWSTVNVTAGVSAPPPPPPSNAFVVYMAPNGNDASSGLDASHPILTLTQAQNVVKARFPSGLTSDVEVRLAAGTYFHNFVTWTIASPTYHIAFLPVDLAGPRPVFDGCTKLNPDPGVDCREPSTADGDGHLFRLTARGGATNIQFKHLEFTHYRNGIQFAGSGLTPSGANGRNRIEDCYFHDLGNAWAPAAYTLYKNATGQLAIKPGYGAVRSLNSDDDEYLANVFDNITNVDDSVLIPGDSNNVSSGWGHMHAYYLANGSDRIHIADNTIHRVSGSSIRIRHYCIGSVFEGNSFTEAGYYAAMSEWEASGECPSWNTIVRDNYVDGGYKCKAADPVWIGGCTTNCQTCTMPVPPGAFVATVSGNCDVKTGPFCTGSTTCVMD